MVNWNIIGPGIVALLTYGWLIDFPKWYFYLVAACISALILGWIIAHIRDEWRNR